MSITSRSGISGKSIKLASWRLTVGGDDFVRRTVLDGSIHPDPDPDDDIDPVRDYGILIEADAGPETEVLGLTVRDCDDGISCYGTALIEANLFINNTDAIDYEAGGGICRGNTFIGQRRRRR